MGLSFGRSSEDHAERGKERGRESPESLLRDAERVSSDAERVSSDAERQLREQLWSSMLHGDRFVLLCLND